MICTLSWKHTSARRPPRDSFHSESCEICRLKPTSIAPHSNIQSSARQYDGEISHPTRPDMQLLEQKTRMKGSDSNNEAERDRSIQGDWNCCGWRPFPGTDGSRRGVLMGTWIVWAAWPGRRQGFVVSVRKCAHMDVNVCKFRHVRLWLVCISWCAHAEYILNARAHVRP